MNRPLSLALAILLTGAGAWASEGPWTSDLAAGIARAQDQERPVAILFSIPGCVWCQRMIEESVSEPAVARALSGYVALHLDAEQHPGLTARLEVRSFPTLVLANRSLAITQVLPGYLSPNDVATALTVHDLHGDEQQGKALAADVDVEAIAAGTDPVAGLIALLGQGSVEQRSAVRAHLGRLSEAEVALWRALDDDAYGVRVDAAAALAELVGASTSYDPLTLGDERKRGIAVWRQWRDGAVVDLP